MDHTQGLSKNRGLKNGRTRFVRLFPERLDFLLARLTDAQFTAYVRVLNEYVIRNGDVPADDKALARIARLSLRQWRALRDELIALGIGRIEDDKWIDDDQDVNLTRQREFSEQQRKRALARWKPEVVA